METLDLRGTFEPENNLASPHELILGQGAILQGRYEILKVLGLGGMGAVYQARDLRFTGVVRLCALKEMTSTTPDPQVRRLAIQNFEREANILASLNHPSIPKVYDYFSEGIRSYLVLDYIQGIDLETLLDNAEQMLPPDQVVDWAIQICDVLSYLHGQDPPIVFRDMKPSNVIMRPPDDIVLIDFGIARVFEAGQRGTMIGTEGYCPPEQYRGIASPHGDIYALGATLHHLLTRRDPRREPPFTFHEEPPRLLNPAVPEQLDAVVMKALEYDPEDRFASAEEMKVALAKCLERDRQEQSLTQVSSPQPSPALRTRLRAAMRRIALVTGLLILLLVGAGSFFIQRQRQPVAQAQGFIDSFRDSTSPNERLASLAGLFNLGGHEQLARQLFFQELSPADQLALFDLGDPPAVGEQLVTVVKGVYTDPNLENNTQNNLLLAAMAQPLSQLGNSPSLGASSLELEIKQWLEGREHHNDRGQVQLAIEAYNVAIGINNRNPGIYFDRGLANAALGESSQALADLATTLSLDESWQGRVQQVLMRDTRIYTALWDEEKRYGTLVSLVPVPTNTPALAALGSPTPMPTDTPIPPTFTPTARPTLTPTAQPTPIPSATSTRVPTPTPRATAGTFALLSPLSLDDPSYGPTDFEWEWTANVPRGFGFEVRVWREGESPAGVHDAVLDNQDGTIETIGENRYRLSVDIADAPGVQGRSGIYLWTVVLVQVSPTYADLGQQADPAYLRFEAGGTGGGGGGGTSSDDSGGTGSDGGGKGKGKGKGKGQG